MQRGAALVALCLLMLASCGGDAGNSAKAGSRPTDAASQTPSEARRDGVVPALAALPLRVRSDPRATLKTSDGAWVISEPSAALDRLANRDTGSFGNENGKYGIDFIGPSEYGEVLLLSDNGKVRRAYPMPSAPPSWLYATDEAVFGGHVGDGCLPNSTLFRIDRKTLSSSLVLFPFEDGGSVTLLPGWRLATKTEAPLIDQVFSGEDTVRVTSGIGPLRVDIRRVAQLFADQQTDAAASGSGSC